MTQLTETFSTYNLRVPKQAARLCYEQLPLKEPDGVRSWPAVLEANSCPNARVVVDDIAEMRVNLGERTQTYIQDKYECN